MNNTMNKVKIGIMPLAAYKARTIAIAKGDYKPKKNEPKIWFNSMKSLASVLSEENQNLLSLIVDEQPQSISELAEIVDRKPNNVLRTLRTMEAYGFVKLIKGRSGGRGRTPIIPKAIYNAADIDLHFSGDSGSL